MALAQHLPHTNLSRLFSNAAAYANSPFLDSQFDEDDDKNTLTSSANSTGKLKLKYELVEFDLKHLQVRTEPSVPAIY